MSKGINSKARVQGASTLVLTTILLLSATLIVLFSANYSIFQQKITANAARNAQAFEAAQAGLEYGIVYLGQNLASIEASGSSGLVNDTLTKVTLSDNSSYTVTFSNPVANTYTLFLIQSTGASDDGTATRVVTQYVSQLPAMPTNSLMSGGSVALSGSSTLTNSITGSNIESGGPIAISNGAGTYNSSGLSSSSAGLKSDVQQNVASIRSLGESAFFANVFGKSETSEESSMGTIYNNTVSNGNYTSLLNGTTHSSIWINQTSGNTVFISSGATVGSATKPVLLIVEGAGAELLNGVTFYGYLYAAGGVVIDLNSRVYGGVSTAGSTSIMNAAGVTYQMYYGIAIGNPNFARVPGTWKDF